MTTIEQFLLEHNRLAPINLQATKEMLLRFQDEKQTLFKDNDWSMEKIRRPLIAWMATGPKFKARHHGSAAGWITFPRPADES